MDKSDDHLSEQFLAQALESTGFASISKIALQRLSRIPAAKMRLFAKRTRQIMIHRDGDKARLEDVIKVLSSDNENVPQLIRFMQSCKRTRAKPHPTFPVVKPVENPLKIPEKDCMELATQPSFLPDYLPLMRDALEYKSTARRLMSDGGLKHSFDQNVFGDKHVNGDQRSETGAKPSYPLEAGRSRYKLRAVRMDEEGRIFCQGSGSRRSAEKSLPSSAFVNPVEAAVSLAPGPEMLSAAFKKTNHRGHSKNGVVGARSSDRRADVSYLPNSFAGLPGAGGCSAGVGDTREHNGGAYSPARDDLPEVEDEDDGTPGRPWPPKEEQSVLGSRGAGLDLSKAGRPPGFSSISDWPPSPAGSGQPHLGGPPTLPSSLALSTPTAAASPRSTKPRRPDRSSIVPAETQDTTPAHKASMSKSSSRPSLLSKPKPKSKSKSKAKSKSKVKSPSSKQLSQKSSSHSSKKGIINGQARPFSSADFPPSGANELPGRDRKRTFEEANSSSGTPTELASPTTSRKELLAAYEPAQLAMRPPVHHKASSRDGGSRASSPFVTKHKRRRVEGGGGGGGGGSDAASLPKSLSPPPRSPALLPGSPFDPMQNDIERVRDRRSQERSREATPKRRLVSHFSSSDEEEEAERRRSKKDSSLRIPSSSKHHVPEWEDVPLSKRVPSNTSKRDARFRERREATPVSEESKEREESLVKLGPKLTMKFNLSKIKKVFPLPNQDSVSGTASPASGTTAPAATTDSKPASPFCVKMEDEEVFDWRKDGASPRRRRSGSLSDGGDDYAVMRFRGPPGPSPPPLPDTEITLDLSSSGLPPDLEDERRVSTDSLQPPSLQPTMPLPKMKIKKVKGTTASFMTAPADSEGGKGVADSEPVEPCLDSSTEPRLESSKVPDRGRSSRSPSPPTLAPVLTPPPTSRPPSHEHAPTLTLVAAPVGLDTVVFDAPEDELYTSPSVHTPTLQRDPVKAKSSKKSGGGASKKKSKRSSSSAKSRSRPRPPPPPPPPSQPERSPTPPTPPAVLEPASEDLGFVYNMSASPSPPEPPEPEPELVPVPEPEPDVRRGKKRPSSGGHNSSRKSAAFDVGLAGLENNNTTTKKAANSSSKSKTSASKSAAAQKAASAPSPIDPSASSSMGIDLISHGSSYYFDSNGVQIWICPTCHMEDNGTLMIGCDSCDDWYHGHCLQIFEAPTEQNWYCPRCIQTNKSNSQKPNKKRKSGAKAGRRR